MVMFLIQSAILLAIAFIAGCVVGCLAHRLLAGRAADRPAAVLAAPAPALAPPVAPAPSPALAAPAAPPPGRDDLKQIRGIGRQAESRLNAAGITTFAQIAAWTARDQKEWGERLAFRGRVEREKWVAQAKVLARGGKTRFADRVEKGEVPTSTGGRRRGGRGKA